MKEVVIVDGIRTPIGRANREGYYGNIRQGGATRLSESVAPPRPHRLSPVDFGFGMAHAEFPAFPNPVRTARAREPLNLIFLALVMAILPRLAHPHLDLGLPRIPPRFLLRQG